MPKVSLIPVKGNSYICSGVLSLGVYVYGNKVILIDSGGDESCAKDVYNAIQEAGLEIAAIINTHCHPDHCGGNAFFQKKNPSLLVYATLQEQQFIEDPLLAPRCFCAQAAPLSGLLNKYIAPQKSSVVTNPITAYDQKIIINGVSFTIIALPGHTPGSIGVITPDNVFYSGDALFGEEVLRKHSILFYTDISNTVASLEKLKTITPTASTLYHGGIIDDLDVLIEKHITKIVHTKNHVLEHLHNQSLGIDLLTQKIMQQHMIPNTVVSLILTQTAIRAYLALLESEKLVNVTVNDGLLLFSSTT